MADEMSTKYILALLSVRAEEVKQLINKVRKQDEKGKDWDGYDTDILIKRLEWLRGVAENRMKDILKAEGKDPADFSL